jgi:uncharacterized protein with PQ loop repeat
MTIGLWILGVIGVILISASPIPQLYKTIKNKQTDDMSIRYFATLTAGCFFLLIYSLLADSNNTVFIVSNTTSFILVGTQTMLILKYRKNEPSESTEPTITRHIPV